MINRRSLLVLATLTALAATWSMSDIRAQVVTTSLDRPVSATVFASWLARGDRLALLVLWRGSPGWFWRGDGGGSGGRGGTIEQFSHTIREGGLTLQIDYDFSRNTARIAGQEFSLMSTNVVLADYVDSPAGATIVGTRFVNPDLPANSDWTDAAIVTIRREPELYDYIQCQVALPQSSDPRAEMMQGLVMKLCDMMRPR